MRSGDERVMSRHLANDQPSTFRGQTNVSSEQFGASASGGSSILESGASNSLHPNRLPMGNLASSLRRSMPAVNAQQQQQHWTPVGGVGQQPSIGGTTPSRQQSRHMSFSIENEQTDEAREKQLAVSEFVMPNSAGVVVGGGGNASGLKQRTAEKGEQGRCTSAHSHTSLSPSGSLVFTSSAATPTNFPNRGLELGTATMVSSGGTSTVLDTRQIQVYLKKREDSRATISTTLSDTSELAAHVHHKFASSNTALPPALPISSIQTITTSTASSNVPLRNTRKVFHSSDTRSSIFSVSSSLDSTKEERIISNLEHTSPVANNRVVVLPRPHQALVPAQQSLQVVDYGGRAGFSGDDEMDERRTGEGSGSSERTTRSSSAEHQRHTSVSPLLPSMDSGSDRRPSADSKRGGSPLISSWHSISDLNSARHSDGGGDIGDKRHTPSLQGYINAEGRMIGGPQSEIWHSPPPPRPQSQASNRRSNYLGELVWQVDETVYCGGIEAAQNQNLLCRLNIEYIVDLSGQEDDPTLANSRPRTEYPCLCPKRTAHSRMTMSIRIKDDSHQHLFNRDARPATVDSKTQQIEREEIIHYFEALIDLIRKARITQKKVLIHSLKGRNRAPAFVAAYLMHCNRVTRVQAINKISKMMSSIRPGVCISDALQRALMRWQSILGIRAESSRLDSQQLNKMFAVKRTAWN